VLAALIERTPILTPKLPAWKVELDLAREARAVALSKSYPLRFTDADEGPDRKQARLRVSNLVEGGAPPVEDEQSMERRLAQRLYLLLRVGDELRLPQVEWEPAADGEPDLSVRERLLREVADKCGDSLQLHWTGNAPLAHMSLPSPAEGNIFFWRLQYVVGHVEPPVGVDYSWLDRDELAERLQGKAGALMREMCGPFP